MKKEIPIDKSAEEPVERLLKQTGPRRRGPLFLCDLLLLTIFFFLAGPVFSQTREEPPQPTMQMRPEMILQPPDQFHGIRPEPPSIMMDLPLSVGVCRPFDLDVWLDTSKRPEGGAVEVSLEQTNRMAYEPRIFHLRPGQRQTVHARVLESPSGLAEIVAAVSGRATQSGSPTQSVWPTQPVWATQSVTVNAGFPGHLRSDLGEFIEGGKARSFNLEFIDHSGNPVRLDAPSKLMLQVTNAMLREKDDEDWSDRLDLALERGASSTPLLQVRSESFSQDTGLLLAELRINDTYVIHSDKFQFTILARWWLPLLMAILGALLHTLYETTREITATRRYSFRLFLRLPQTIASLLAGVLAYLLATYNILGVDIKTTSLRGFVILGFLFSYVGLGLILKKLVSARTQSPNPPSTSG